MHKYVVGASCLSLKYCLFLINAWNTWLYYFYFLSRLLHILLKNISWTNYLIRRSVDLLQLSVFDYTWRENMSKLARCRFFMLSCHQSISTDQISFPYLVQSRKHLFAGDMTLAHPFREMPSRPLCQHLRSARLTNGHKRWRPASFLSINSPYHKLHADWSLIGVLQQGYIWREKSGCCCRERELCWFNFWR